MSENYFKTIWESDNEKYNFSIYTIWDNTNYLRPDEVKTILPYIEKNVELRLNKNLCEIFKNCCDRHKHSEEFMGAYLGLKNNLDEEGCNVSVIKFKMGRTYIYQIEINDMENYDELDVIFFCGSYKKFLNFMKKNILELCEFYAMSDEESDEDDDAYRRN